MCLHTANYITMLSVTNACEGLGMTLDCQASAQEPAHSDRERMRSATDHQLRRHEGCCDAALQPCQRLRGDERPGKQHAVPLGHHVLHSRRAGSAAWFPQMRTTMQQVTGITDFTGILQLASTPIGKMTIRYKYLSLQLTTRKASASSDWPFIRYVADAVGGCSWQALPSPGGPTSSC